MNTDFLNKAAACQRELFTRQVQPIDCFRLQQAENGGWEAVDRMPFSGQTPRLNKGDSLCLDFGTHWVGYLSFSAQPVGGAADAPAYLRITAGERLCDLIKKELKRPLVKSPAAELTGGLFVASNRFCRRKKALHGQK